MPNVKFYAIGALLIGLTGSASGDISCEMTMPNWHDCLESEQDELYEYYWDENGLSSLITHPDIPWFVQYDCAPGDKRAVKIENVVVFNGSILVSADSQKVSCSIHT